MYKIALVLSLIYTDEEKDYIIDYHWYRQNPDGTWSHKPGNDTIRNWDNTMLTIYAPNPDLANTFDYNYLVGYYAIGYNYEQNVEEQKLSLLNIPSGFAQNKALRNTTEKLTLEQFNVIQKDMPESQIINILGYPHERAGSGRPREIYKLNDNNEVVLIYTSLGYLEEMLLFSSDGITQII